VKLAIISPSTIVPLGIKLVTLTLAHLIMIQLYLKDQTLVVPTYMHINDKMIFKFYVNQSFMFMFEGNLISTSTRTL